MTTVDKLAHQSDKVDRNTLVIVALPEAQDYVWKISSEKVPHMTLLYLGEHDAGPATARIVDFVEHAAKTSLKRFGMSVNRRGKLGADEADVLFFEKKWSESVADFRSQLLANQEIAKAYHSVDQFPEWTPHLTLGYPDAPAHPDPRDYPGISWINFDRISVWTGDSEGPEFVLEEQELSVSMSDGAKSVDDILAHYGKKGMKWGVRNADRGAPVSAVATQKKPGTKLTATGGKNLPASDDAKRAAEARQKAKASTVASLSNKELQDLVNRMNLESNFNRLSTTQKSAGKKFVESLFKDKNKRQQTVDNVNDLLKVPKDALSVGDAIRKTDLSKIGT